MRALKPFGLALLLLLPALAGCMGAQDARPVLLVASTTSARDTGFLDYIQALYEKDHDVRLRITAVGTGHALRLAENGDADVLVTHARAREEAFVAAGHGLWRKPFMFNYFYVAGPASDPAGISGMNASDAFAAIARANATFASRGDQSGTHIKELSLWSWTSHRPDRTHPSWYLETGAGMGQTLLVAQERGAYVLTDDSTYHAFHDLGHIPGLVLHVTQDPELRNQYAVIPVSPEAHPHRNAGEAVAFAQWLLGAQGQAAIERFRVGDRQLFTPNADDASA